MIDFLSRFLFYTDGLGFFCIFLVLSDCSQSAFTGGFFLIFQFADVLVAQFWHKTESPCCICWSLISLQLRLELSGLNWIITIINNSLGCVLLFMHCFERTLVVSWRFVIKMHCCCKRNFTTTIALQVSSCLDY